MIISVLFWGWVLGPMGMLLAVPLTMSVKIALESDEHTLAGAADERTARTGALGRLRGARARQRGRG